ncbi:flagellar basal body-associated FliL family protein [Chitinibacter bivalviorum]|uniref:Flagellar protein FliL n=1 Tax=Chitinibacter bivalviorum TaxID=2739434 RepID=A0A7H9BDL2_9NEIS|nr:flagellar basal body-associated FliL family protein [Chitinibacter bivalviorum]QLG86790.1 flagellar basal body-associated FliL family protein [Chitinibacter bivalviorum]
MSEAKADPKADAAPKSKKNILLFAIIGLVVLVLIVGGALAFFLLKSPAEGNADEAVAEANAHADAEKKEKEKKKKEKEKGEHKAPVFDKLQDQPFTVNLAGETESVLQAEIMVELSDEHEKEKLKGLQPKVLDAVNRLIRSKTLEEVKTTKGQEDLAREIREKINEIMEVEAKDEGVLSVNFTKYFYQ